MPEEGGLSSREAAIEAGRRRLRKASRRKKKEGNTNTGLTRPPSRADDGNSSPRTTDAPGNGSDYTPEILASSPDESNGQVSTESQQQHIDRLQVANNELEAHIRTIISERDNAQREAHDALGFLQVAESKLGDLVTSGVSQTRQLKQALAEREILIERCRVYESRSAESESLAQIRYTESEQVREQLAKVTQLVSERDAEISTLKATLSEARSAEMDVTSQAHIAIQEAKRLRELTEDQNKRISAHAITIEEQRAGLGQFSAELVKVQLEMKCYDSTSKQKDQVLERARTDAEALSRATLKNKQMSNSLQQLEKKVVEISNANMELTTQLQAAEHRVSQLEHISQQYPKTEASSRETIEAVEVNQLRQVNKTLREVNTKLQQELEAAPSFELVTELKRQLNAMYQENLHRNHGVANDSLNQQEIEHPTGEPDKYDQASKESLKSVKMQQESVSGQSLHTQDTLTENDGSTNTVDEIIERLPQNNSVRSHDQKGKEHLSQEISKLEIEQNQLLEPVQSHNQIENNKQEGGDGMIKESTNDDVSDENTATVESPRQSHESAILNFSSALSKGTKESTQSSSDTQIVRLRRQLIITEDEIDELKARYDYSQIEVAELQAKLRKEEERTVQLAIETETIGDYIILYQESRQRSNERLAEKNQVIAELQATIDEYCTLLASLQNTCSQSVQDGREIDKSVIQALAFAAIPNAKNDSLSVPGEENWEAIEKAARGGGDPTTTPVPRYMFLDSSFREV